MNVFDVSNYVLEYCKKNNIKDCTNKKLQKLLYYIQAWNLVFNDRRMFNSDIKAWLHGPVIETVYYEYKRFGFNPITSKICNTNVIEKNDIELINSVLNKYGNFDADYLEMRTHIERPWVEARKTDKDIITDEGMKTYYSEILKTYDSRK